MTTFESLGLPISLLKLLETQGYKIPTPIQKEAIPYILNKKDVLGIAKTGSGKTVSYVLPILINASANKNKKNRFINILILVPTRELAIQVESVFKLFQNAVSNVKSMAVFGGVSINPQMKNLSDIDILIATPGRLLELIESNALHLGEIETLVLDEADKMLNEGFTIEVNKILNLLPKKRQNLLFSATLNNDINNIKQIILNNPKIIEIESEENEIDLINQVVYFISEEKKGPLLRYLIISQNMKQVLIFTSSVKRADRVAEKLRKNGLEAEAIHRKKSQGARTNLLTKFKNHKLNILVSTDLLARGIDIELLPYVINYELPRSPKMFVHRIGRTGRADSYGEAITLITPSEEAHFKIIEKKMKKNVEIVDIENLDLKGW